MKSLITLLLFTLLSSSLSAGTLTLSGKDLSFSDIEDYFRKELRQVKSKPYNLFIKLTPERKAELNKKSYTINLTGLTLKQGLSSFAKTTGLSLSIEGRIVILSDRSKMLTKTYYVYTEFADQLRKGKNGKPLASSTKKFLSSLGVKFPKGSGANYSLTRNIVTMTNTPENHKQLRFKPSRNKYALQIRFKHNDQANYS